MHIPENYLSPATCGVMTAAVLPVWIHSVRAVSRALPREKISLIGVGAAFSFVGMMFNVPLAGGTTGHAVGGTLIAVLLGPEAACLAVSVALLLQAVLFGDGGILSFGANSFNMAFILPFVGYAVYRLLAGKRERLTTGRQITAAAVGSYAGINAAAFCAAVEFGLQPAIAHSADGTPLYFPYGLNISIPAMMAGHLTVFGLVEVIFTAAILNFVLKTSPDIIAERWYRSDREAAFAASSVSSVPNSSAGMKKRRGAFPLYALLAVLTAFVPLGLLATGDAWGEWGVEDIANDTSAGSALGYTPSGMANGQSLPALLPDYTVPGLPDVAGYIICAVIGAAILIIVFRLIGSAVSGHHRGAAPDAF